MLVSGLEKMQGHCTVGRKLDSVRAVEKTLLHVGLTVVARTRRVRDGLARHESVGEALTAEGCWVCGPAR